MPLYTHAKNIFWISIMLILAPLFIAIIKEEYGSLFNPHNKIGVIDINGPIITSEAYIKQLNTLFKDPLIKGIMLHIECQEGYPGSAQLIYQEIEYLKKEYPKPIITLVENICTAQGYVVAAATDTIIAPATAIVGGIWPIVKSLMHNAPEENIADTQLEQSSDKNTLSAYNQKIIDDIYNHTIGIIAQRRKLALKDHELWGKGQMFTGNQALKLHLIDQIGCVTDARNCIKEKALIDGDVQWIHAVEKKYIIF